MLQTTQKKSRLINTSLPVNSDKLLQRYIAVFFPGPLGYFVLEHGKCLDEFFAGFLRFDYFINK
ncbi:MAG TPA: hypothetical protein PKA77_15715, partial [Chitinophagaceae bacterium]|nr:hypothetical protein [Chitinophagaceae bacterium]